VFPEEYLGGRAAILHANAGWFFYYRQVRIGTSQKQEVGVTNNAQQILAIIILAAAFIAFFTFMFILNKKSKK
jgi:hypothetical protein